MLSRRDLLACVAGAAAGVATGLQRREAFAQAPRSARGPRYFLSIYLSGGIDPITSSDPKVRAEVEPWVDLPYARDAIVEAGGLRLGPHLAPLAPFAGRLTLLQGVALRTANHNTGAEQFLRFRTRTVPRMPTLFQLLGERREGQAVGCMDWLFGATQFTRLFATTPRADLGELAHALRGEAKKLRDGASSVEARATAASVDETAALFDRVAALPPIAIERWSEKPDEQSLAVQLQRVLWVFEHDLARCFELNVGGLEQPWDTHTFNADRQGKASARLAMVARFLGELGRRRSARGPLAAETLVVMGSEIGRFPALNTARGKDHFPEAPFFLWGAGMGGAGKGAVIGRTGKNMAALPVSLSTGKDASPGHVLALDDLGATLLRIGGVADPRVYGYDGRVLEPLT